MNWLSVASPPRDTLLYRVYDYYEYSTAMLLILNSTLPDGERKRYSSIRFLAVQHSFSKLDHDFVFSPLGGTLSHFTPRFSYTLNHKGHAEPLAGVGLPHRSPLVPITLVEQMR